MPGDSVHRPKVLIEAYFVLPSPFINLNCLLNCIGYTVRRQVPSYQNAKTSPAFFYVFSSLTEREMQRTYSNQSARSNRCRELSLCRTPHRIVNISFIPRLRFYAEREKKKDSGGKADVQPVLENTKKRQGEKRRRKRRSLGASWPGSIHAGYINKAPGATPFQNRFETQRKTRWQMLRNFWRQLYTRGTTTQFHVCRDPHEHATCAEVPRHCVGVGTFRSLS